MTQLKYSAVLMWVIGFGGDSEPTFGSLQLARVYFKLLYWPTCVPTSKDFNPWQSSHLRKMIQGQLARVYYMLLDWHVSLNRFLFHDKVLICSGVVCFRREPIIWISCMYCGSTMDDCLRYLLSKHTLVCIFILSILHSCLCKKFIPTSSTCHALVAWLGFHLILIWIKLRPMLFDFGVQVLIHDSFNSF